MSTSGLNTKKKRSLNELQFAIVVAASYFVAGLLIASFHEFWRDELEPWTLARHSSSLANLLANMRYEGHPILWYTVLYGVSHVFSTPEAMKFANLALAAGAVFLVARYSPMPRWFRGLFSFGFYPFYQYGVISRGYALCNLVLFVFCALYHLRKTRLWVLSIVLALLANADVYGWFFTAALSVGLIVGWIVDQRAGRPWRAGIPELFITGAVVLAGMLLSVKLSAPPADGGWFQEWHLYPSWQRVLVVIYGLKFDLNFGPEWMYILPSGVLLVWFTLGISRRTVAFSTWTSFIIALVAFYYTKFQPAFWHKGMLFMFLVACLWLAYNEKENDLPLPKLNKIGLGASRTLMRFLALVVMFYALYAWKWIIQDYIQPYSTVGMAATFIKQNGLQDCLIAGDEDFAVQGVSACIDRPIYFLASRSMGRYVIWDNKRKWPLPQSELCDQVNSLRASTSGKMLLILNYDLEPDACRRIDARLLKSFSNAMQVKENLRIYAVEPVRRGGQP